MPDLKLPQTRSLAQRVTARLREAITTGEFRPGSIIPEEMLAQSFGVSRTPVREALNQLQREGLVVVRPQVGSFVFSPDAADMALLCQFRLGLEPWAAELAHGHMRAKTEADLDLALRDMAVALDARDRIGFARADTAFHEAFILNCGNQYIVEAYRLIGGRVHALRTNYSAPIDVEISGTIEGHQDLARLFREGDFAGFKAMTKQLLDEAEEAFRDLLHERSRSAEGDGYTTALG